MITWIKLSQSRQPANGLVNLKAQGSLWKRI
jgi:hypothetical protein